MDGLIDFLSVHSLFSGIRPSKNTKKFDIEIILVYFTPPLLGDGLASFK